MFDEGEQMFDTCYGRTDVLRTARRRGRFFSKGLFLCKSGAGTTAPAPMCRYLCLPIQQYVCTYHSVYVCSSVCILLLLCMYVYVLYTTTVYVILLCMYVYYVCVAHSLSSPCVSSYCTVCVCVCYCRHTTILWMCVCMYTTTMHVCVCILCVQQYCVCMCILHSVRAPSPPPPVCAACVQVCLWLCTVCV